MCDISTAASAGLDIYAGFQSARGAMAKGELEAAQFKGAAILAIADASREKTELRREFTQQSNANVAAAAASGLDLSSFEGITEGNKQEMRRAAGVVDRNSKRQYDKNMYEADMAMLRARADADAAKFAGFSSAFMTIAEGEEAYQEGNTGESRFDYFKNSLFQKVGS